MLSTRPRFQALVICLLAWILAPALAGASTDPTSRSLEGILLFEWGDPDPERGGLPIERAHLTQDDGRRIFLSLDPALLPGGTTQWHGRRVVVDPVVEGEKALSTYGPGIASPALPVAALRPAPGAAPAPRKMVTGSQPWISLPCKFSDIADEPRDLAFFQGMYGNTAPGLDHFWREVSYDQIDIVGSTSVDWLVLPNPRSHYITLQNVNGNMVEVANLDLLFTECTGVADPFVDFSNGGTGGFAGINLMFNAALDCCAWGGAGFKTLDGVAKVWRITWEPPFGYANAGVIAHEMGHGFGLPHANNSDGDANPYDSPWDVMSWATGYSAIDGTYGALGKHVNAYHKDRLGWIPAARLLDVPRDSVQTVTIDHTVISSTSNYRMAKIAIPDTNDFYTVEVRKLRGSYESDLPGEGVIIHYVDPDRSEPSWVVDGEVPPADYSSNAGCRWIVGETYADAANAIQIEVLSETTDGYTVRITNGSADVIFSDGFESGDVLQWSSSSP